MMTRVELKQTADENTNCSNLSLRIVWQSLFKSQIHKPFVGIPQTKIPHLCKKGSGERMVITTLCTENSSKTQTWLTGA